MGRELSDLVEQHKALVYHVITRMIPESQHHDDLFQETFLNVARSITTFRRESKLSTWIFRVAQNTCLSHIRRMRRDPTYSWAAWLEEDAGDRAAEQAGDGAEAMELGARLDHALNQLPPKYRLPIALYYQEDMSYREIAACLSIPIGTVKTNIHRGLLRLRAILGEDSDAYL